jgi:hypothetical protein
MLKKRFCLSPFDERTLSDFGCACNQIGEEGSDIYDVIFPEGTELLAVESYSLLDFETYEPVPGLIIAGAGQLEYFLLPGVGLILETGGDPIDTQVVFCTTAHIETFRRWTEEINRRQYTLN